MCVLSKVLQRITAVCAWSDSDAEGRAAGIAMFVRISAEQDKGHCTFRLRALQQIAGKPCGVGPRSVP